MKLTELLSDSFLEHELFKRALTHRSSGNPHNERLEFLGDAVIQLLISNYLYKRFDSLSEGQLTKMRAHLVCKEMLASLAHQLRVREYLVLGQGETNPADSILADTFEAIAGALYLVEGHQASWQFVKKAYAEELDRLSMTDDFKDAKTRLQEYLQASGEDLPLYQIIRQNEQDYFQVSCAIAAYKIKTTGEGRSRRQAEQQAASNALTTLGEQGIE